MYNFFGKNMNVDNLFNNDLEFEKGTIINFTPKLEYEFQVLWRKIKNKIGDNDTIDIDTIYDRFEYEDVEKIGSFIDKNVKTKSNLMLSSDLIEKVFIFIDLFIDYSELKKKLKKQ